MFDAVTYGAAVGAAKKYTDEHSGGTSDAVKYTEQTLTSAQQAQARTNIGAANAADVPTAEQQAVWSAKQDALTFDSIPTQSSANPVTSDGIYTALQSAGVQSDWSQGNSSEKDFIKNKPPIQNGHGTGGNLEGGTIAYATYSNSFAYGHVANANADYAFAFGLGVNAAHSNEVALGKYNISSADTAFSIGDGSGVGATPYHNLMELKTDGRMFLNGNETAIKNDVDAVNRRCDDIIDMIEDKTVIYGFHVNPNESDPADAVTYLADAVGMTPAAMGTTTFDYGSWKDAFFMPRPCMLKYDGTVDYYLDPNDYSKKLDGTASDISDYSYSGNAMMEFPKLWFKFEAGTAEGEGYFYVSNKQLDSSYHCWANYDSDGNQIDHFYMAIYNGVIYDGKMRSLSGKKLSPWSATAYSSSATYAVDDVVNYDGKMWKCITAVENAETFDPEKWEQFGFNGNATGQQEVDAAVANDTTAKSEWYIDTWCDRVLITALLYLMGKSLDLQSTYGRGIDDGNQPAAENYVTGAANDKGLFYGDTANGNSVDKVFGIENFWALKWRRTAGCIGLNNGKVAYKMTSSAADGSTATAYNTDGTGYLIDNTVRPSSGYVTKMGFGAWGLIPRSVTGGNSNIYYCDYFYTNNSATTFALVGGYSSSGLYCGFCVGLNNAFASRYWGLAAALSCKPLANKEV